VVKVFVMVSKAQEKEAKVRDERERGEKLWMNKGNGVGTLLWQIREL